MAEENKDQKTEEASSKKISDAEEKGNFALSKEMTSSVILLAAILSLYIVGHQGPLEMMALWRAILSELHTLNLSTEELFRALILVMKNTFLIFHYQNQISEMPAKLAGLMKSF